MIAPSFPRGITNLFRGAGGGREKRRFFRDFSQHAIWLTFTATEREEDKEVGTPPIKYSHFSSCTTDPISQAARAVPTAAGRLFFAMGGSSNLNINFYRIRLWFKMDYVSPLCTIVSLDLLHIVVPYILQSLSQRRAVDSLPHVRVLVSHDPRGRSGEMKIEPLKPHLPHPFSSLTPSYYY